MVEVFNILYLVSLGYYPQSVGEVLRQWEQAGVFSYVLPFLLIFSLVYLILVSIKIFGGQDGKNRGFVGLISLSVALLALQFEIVPIFFSIIFPRLGIAVAIILCVVIIMALFSPEASWMGYVYLGIGATTLIVLLVSSGSVFGNVVSLWIQENWMILFGGVVAIVIASIMFGDSGNRRESTKTSFMKFLESLGR